MASNEHKDLAAFIKSIHSNLRQESHIYGPDEAWKRHVAESDRLQVRWRLYLTVSSGRERKH